MKRFAALLLACLLLAANLITGLQHTFKIQLRDNKDLLQIRTLEDVYNLVEKIIAEHPEVLEKLEK